MYEHEGKLLLRDDDGILHSVYLTMTETGGCKVTLLKETFNSRPHGATQVTVDAIVRQHNLQAGQSYPSQSKEAEETSTAKSEQEKIAAMVNKTAAKTKPTTGNK